MRNYIIFGCGCTLNEDTVNEVSKKIINILAKELPLEAQNYEVYSHVLKKSTERIRFISFKL